MLLAGIFLAALVRARASPIPPSLPGNSISSPLCVATAMLTYSKCDSASTRTMFDIVYSSIRVIFLCTYVSVHHNIPNQKHAWFRVTLQKLRTMLCALLAPEIMIMWALKQRIMAGRIAEKNKHRGWTKTHGFFIQMGGLVQRKTGNSVHYQVVTPDNLDRTNVPYIPEKEIKDHGKGDMLSKAIVVLQTTWFIIQCFSRSFQGLAVTEIELVALAFAVLNAITYGLWWSKPLNIEYPIYFDEEGRRVDGPGADERQAEISREKGSENRGEYWRDLAAGIGLLVLLLFLLPILLLFVLIFLIPYYLFKGMMMDETEDPDSQTCVRPFYSATMDDGDFTLAMAYASIIGMAFGSVHLIGWNFPFPTPTGLGLWRASSLILTLSPPVVAVHQALHFVSSCTSDNSLLNKLLFLPRYLLGFLMVISVAAYVSARFVILFLTFYTLHSLPESAYETVKWVEFIPRV
ncbi:hypothetical protein AX16_000841 [Volvariella volvacea WC 439]|nr:hypothetical protein AX16_000841 [Volvariella volvacea WC 439]